MIPLFPTIMQLSTLIYYAITVMYNKATNRIRIINFVVQKKTRQCLATSPYLFSFILIYPKRRIKPLQGYAMSTRVPQEDPVRTRRYTGHVLPEYRASSEADMHHGCQAEEDD